MALGLGSDRNSDVYSFGVVLWEVASLQKPKEQFKMKKGLCQGRLNYSFRPSVASIPSPALQTLINECWAFRSSDRPNFKKILNILKVIPMEIADRPIAPASTLNAPVGVGRAGSDRALEKISNKELGIDRDEGPANSTRSDSRVIGVTYTAGPLVNRNIGLSASPSEITDENRQPGKSSQTGEANEQFKESLKSTNTAATDPSVSAELPVSVHLTPESTTDKT